MAVQRHMVSAGLPAPTANAVVGNATDGLTATGNSQATALAITTTASVVTTTAASTGLILPTWADPGDEFYVLNQGASTLTVYPPLGDTINGGAANAGYSVPANNAAHFKALTGTKWMAMVSA